MNATTPEIREWARRLIALETPRDARRAASAGDAAGVCERLRVPLTKLVGTAGYHSLISRALAMAKAQAPVLEPVRVRLDGSLESFAEINEIDGDAGVAVVGHLLSLLVTFVGEPLTLSLIRSAWTDVALMNPREERQS
jgi:hypothetical protein